jgi:uncharacterized protein YggE
MKLFAVLVSAMFALRRHGGTTPLRRRRQHHSPPNRNGLEGSLARRLGHVGPESTCESKDRHTRTEENPMRLILFMLALTPMVASAQARDTTIAVSASRTTRVLADRATLYVTVEGTAETPADALTRAGTKLNAVIEAIQMIRPRVEADRPISYGVANAPPQNYTGAPVAPAYLARSVIRVTITRLDQLVILQAAVLAAGAASTPGLVFEASAADSVRRARLSEVIASAKADAEVMAAAQGARLGAIIDMSTNAFTGQGQPGFLNFDSRYSPQAPAPEVVVTTNITIRYRLVR